MTAVVFVEVVCGGDGSGVRGIPDAGSADVAGGRW